MRRLSLVLALCTALLWGCAGADEPAAEPSASPSAASSSGEEAADAPERIVSLAPTHTETLFAIGAGDQVVAVDEQSDHPAEAPVTDLSGLTPNVEAIIGYEPDLVVLSDDLEGVVDGLEAVGVETLLLPAPDDVEGAYGQMTELGAATGHAEEAEALVARLRARIEELVGGLPERAEPLTYFHELDDTLFTVTSSTFVGQLYAMAGLSNVADPADPDGSLGGYPQLTPEFLVEADPDLIFLADTECCGQSAETLAARPGLGGLTAVRDGRVIGLSDDVASRWGPRVVDLLATVVDATAAVPVR